MSVVHPPIATEPDALVRPSRSRGALRRPGRERIVSLALAGLFLAGAAAFAVGYDSHRSPSAVTVVLLVLVYAVASRVDFDVGAGSVVPTELVLVPMLFLLPLELVPLYVALALVIAHVPDFLRGRRRPEVLIGSARHALGPALVLTAVASHGPRLSDWPWYLAALAAQFAFDAAGYLVRQRLITRTPPRTGAEALATAFGVDGVLAPVGFVAALVSVGHAERFLLVVPLLALLAVLARHRQTSISRALELGSAYRGTAFLLADVIEGKDAYTGAHSRQVVKLALAVADGLGLSAEQRRDAELAALLHDIGKIWEHELKLVGKPGDLTVAERELINEHTVKGERMLRRVGGALGEVGSIVRSCHERWDGRGYPDGLAGEDIPLVARIVACCDAYSAMTTDRSYHSAIAHDEALRELQTAAGTQFDPEIVDALVRVLSR